MTQIYITQLDLEKLNKLLAKRKPYDEYDEALVAEISLAKVVKPESVPSDVITMNSSVELKDELGGSREYQLVFPEDVDLMKNKISILSPVGCALIGHRVGDSITIPTPKGGKELRVEAIVYQPERSGNYDL